MEQALNNPYIYWIITGIVGFLFGTLTYLMKRQREKDEKRFDLLEKRVETDRERLNEFAQQLPINYTLRDEFLRVTTSQNAKLDKIFDGMSIQTAAIASLDSTIKMQRDGGNKG